MALERVGAHSPNSDLDCGSQGIADGCTLVSWWSRRRKQAEIAARALGLKGSILAADGQRITFKHCPIGFDKVVPFRDLLQLNLSQSVCPPFVRVPETTSPKNCRYWQRSGLGFVGL